MNHDLKALAERAKNSKAPPSESKNECPCERERSLYPWCGEVGECVRELDYDYRRDPCNQPENIR
jgi:hypothetical protein